MTTKQIDILLRQKTLLLGLILESLLLKPPGASEDFYNNIKKIWIDAYFKFYYPLGEIDFMDDELYKAVTKVISDGVRYEGNRAKQEYDDLLNTICFN